MKDNQKVVVIGHSYLSRLALIRSLGQAGWDVAVIVTMYGTVTKRKPLDCYSKYVSEVYYCNAKDEAGLVKILLERRSKGGQPKDVIIPDSDFSAAFVDQNRTILNVHYLFPTIIGTSTVADWMNKSRQKVLAKEVGLLTANSHIIHFEDGKKLDLNGIKYPCFTKALATMNGGKQCFRECDSEFDLNNALALFHRSGFNDILVEDYLKIEREYAAVGLSDGSDVYIPGIIRFVENSTSHPGIARKGQIIPVGGYEELLERFSNYVKETHFVGLFDIDFLKCKGEFYFCEMNFRFGGSGYSYTKSGFNLPAMFAELMIGNGHLPNPLGRILNNQTYINEKMLLDDYAANKLTFRELKEGLGSADISFICDTDDPSPARRFMLRIPKEMIKRLIKRTLIRR